jgi:hypothetical protein
VEFSPDRNGSNFKGNGNFVKEKKRPRALFFYKIGQDFEDVKCGGWLLIKN